MGRLSRRVFLGSSAGAAGVALLATQSTASAASTGRPGSSTTDHDDDIAGVAAMFYVRDADAGEVVIMKDDHEVVVVDRKLVASLARATRNGKA